MKAEMPLFLLSPLGERLGEGETNDAAGEASFFRHMLSWLTNLVLR
jgi:hypothetical protein